MPTTKDTNHWCLTFLDTYLFKSLLFILGPRLRYIVPRLMWLACHEKSYLISDEIFVLRKKIRNRMGEYSKIRNFVTYQTTFLMTCQQH